MNYFFENLQKNIVKIPDNLKQNYINSEVNKLLNKINTNNIYTTLNYFFEVKKIAGNYSLNKKEKIKYCKNECDIILIAQYYKTDDEQRQKENDISLLNNILNDSITKIHLLNEKEYNLDHILLKVQPSYKNKVKQHVIEKRMTFHDGMGFANTFCKNKIIIISNLDIFFTPELDICKTYDFTNLFCSLSRYELLNDYNFNGDNKIAKFIHNGTLGNPCIDSHDAWIFKSPIRMTPKSKIMLGSAGCDTIINYVYGEIMKYNVVNPIDSIITIHYHREREREYCTQNNVRSHSGLEYNKDNSFVPDDYQHKYILHKEIVVCNEIKTFCTFATKGAYKDLRLLLHSLELYHPEVPIFILCDKWVNDKIDEDEYNLKIYKRIDLEKYTDMNRNKMEEQNLFTEFLLKKADVIDYAMECYENTLFIDGDIVILNKLDLLIDKKYDVGLSPHHILEESEKMFGKYNAGFMYIANKNITNNWRELVNKRNTFDDQQSLDYFEEDFKVFKFDDSYNYGWWRLFQCENPQERLNLFTIDDNIYYEFNTLKCIHTHLYEKNDQQTIQFNKLILQMLETINHPMLKYINQSDEEIMEEKKTIPKIIIPKIPRNDFWNHSGDTFRELVSMWKEQGYCDIVEEDTKHVWMNKIGDVLLYDRPTLDWLAQDSNIKCNKILFGNPIVPDNLKNNASNWIFWGRSPRKLEEFHNMSYIKFNERRLKSIFIGKIENQVQLTYRNIDFSKYIQLYVMHKPDEKYRYTQDEYLDLLRNSKFGLCLRGFGPKCNREIELMGLGTVPLVETNVDMDNYYDPPQENVHYLRFTSPEDIELLINNCSEEKWTQMSLACREWYKKNASKQGSFKTTMDIIKQMDMGENKSIEKTKTQKLQEKIQKTSNSILECKKELEIVDNFLETFDLINNLKEVSDIEDKIIYDFGIEEKFDRPNLKSFYNIKEIYDKHKNTHGDCDWNGVNTFERIQKKYIAKFVSVKINTDGVMYDNENVYTLNNSYYKKSMIEKKNEFQEFGDDVVVFNCVQKWAYGYYHWICEIFPRLFYIKLYIENNREIFENKKIVLMLYYNNEFIRQYLEILNLKNVSICPYNYNIEYKCNCVFMMTPSYCGNPSRDSIMLVRKSIFMNNILVPRANVVLKRTNNRIIGNFDEMMTFLRNKYNNYEWIVFDDSDPKWKSMTNTIQLFSSAKLIIGAHGAGLSNMMFSSDKVKVIELHPTSCGNVCYWHLSHILGNTHNILPVKYKNDKEFDVELDKLDYTVDKLINDVFCSDNILF